MNELIEKVFNWSEIILAKIRHDCILNSFDGLTDKTKSSTLKSSLSKGLKSKNLQGFEKSISGAVYPEDN